MYPSKKLSEISTLFGDGDWIESKDQSESGIRLIQTGNIGIGYFKDKGDKARYISEETFHRLKCTELLPGDLLISRLPDPIGRSCILPKLNKRSITAVDCTIIRFCNEVITEYINFYTQSNSYLNQINNHISGSTRQRISRGKLGTIEIPLPPLSTQSRIVACLDSAFASIDEQISLLRANITDVENMKFGVIEKIFEEGNFEIKTLKDVCERIMDGTHFSPKNSDTGDRLYVSAKNIKLHGVDLTKATYISQEDHEVIYKRCPVKKGDVLYIKDGATTGIATINQLDEEFSLLSSVAVFQVKKNILSGQFLNYYLNSNFGKKHMISMMGGAAITRLTLTKLNSGLIPLPSLPRQHEIVAHLDRVFAETTTLKGEYEAQIRDLQILKQSLLEEAFTGRLVPEDEA